MPSPIKASEATSVYDSSDVDMIASVFINRVSQKLRSLAQCKRAFQDIVAVSVKEQEGKYREMMNFVEEKTGIVTQAKKVTKELSENFEKAESLRKAKMIEVGTNAPRA